MYLPYLALASRSAGSAPPARIPPRGYRTVPTLAFEPDELSVLVRAVRQGQSRRRPRARPRRRLRDPETLIRPRLWPSVRSPPSPTTRARELAESGAAPAVMVLGEALLRRKRVTFAYRSMSRDVTEERTVEPYGLVFSSGHWYLAGRDTAAGALRKFRVSRMERVTANTKKPQSADYEIPSDFHLAELCRDKGRGSSATTRLRTWSSRSAATPAPRRPSTHSARRSLANPAQRRFHVRRVDSFARWVMSFAGDVVPVSPPRLREQYRAIIAATLAVYDARPDGAAHDDRRRRATPARAPRDAAHRRSRRRADRRVRARAGVDALTLLDDLRVLTEREDEPGGFVEAVSILFDERTVSVHSPHFGRPTRITLPELCALELGLAILGGAAAADERVRDRSGARASACGDRRHARDRGARRRLVCMPDRRCPTRGS